MLPLLAAERQLHAPPPSEFRFPPEWAAIHHTRFALWEAAEEYRRWGWSVVPLFEKKPVGPWKGLQDWPLTRRGLEKAFGLVAPPRWRKPTPPPRIDGVGVVLGPVSGGLYVRDFDTREGYERWEAAHPELACRLPTAFTSRGAHVFARYPRPLPYLNAKSGGPGWDAGELLSRGRFAVLAPSVHPSGTSYRWRTPPAGSEDFPVIHPAQAGFLPADHPSLKTKNPAAATAERGPVPGIPCVTTKPWLEGQPVEVAEREAVLKCLPTGPGERNDCLFRLARSLKAVPHLADAPADEVEGAFGVWWGFAVGVVRTRNRKTSWREFTAYWASVTTPMGFGFKEALRRALAGPPAPEANRFEDEPTRKLATVCQALQRYAGGGTFFLSCRDAQEVCGFNDHMTANRRLNRLIREGLLELVERGTRKGNQASTYRWRGQVEVARPERPDPGPPSNLSI